MGNIDITFNTNARQDARLATILENENAGRVADGLEPFVDAEEMIREWVITQAVSRIQTLEAELAVNIQPAFNAATISVQNEVLVLLGLSEAPV